jgi:hypothetical protein
VLTFQVYKILWSAVTMMTVVAVMDVVLVVVRVWCDV